MSNKNEEKKPYIKSMSEEDIKDYLKDAITIPREQWMNLYMNSHICYRKNDGGFVRSGYIKLSFTSKDGEDCIRYGTKIDRYNNDKYYREFTVKLSNIKELYKKVDQSAIMEYKIIKTNIANSLSEFTKSIEEVSEKINMIEERLIKLEDNHIKTIKLIKKLHNINSLDDLKK